MENQPVIVNQRVRVLAIFDDSGAEARYCLPLKMRWNKRDYQFNKLGLRHPTIKGQRLVHILDVSDDNADFRLEFDAQRLTWTLIHIAEVSHARS